MQHASMVPRGRVAVALTCVAVPAAAAKQRSQDRLNAYTVVTTADQLAAFEAKGLDVADSEVRGTNVRANMILTRAQAQDVRAAGASAKLTRVKGGKTVKQFAAAQAVNGYTVWRSYDEPGGYPRPDVRARAQVPAASPSSSRSARRSRAARSSR